MIEPTLALWSDDPARVDLLSFDAVAKTVADALLDEALAPVTLGLSGSWGSGKTTVLGLVAQELDRPRQNSSTMHGCAGTTRRVRRVCCNVHTS